MIEEVIPASRPPRKLKMVSPLPEVNSQIPVIESHISFVPFVNFLKEKLLNATGTRAKYFTQLINRIESDSSFKQYLEGNGNMEGHEELLELLSTAIFPVVCDEADTNYTLSGPYNFNIFSYSQPFRNLFIDKEEKFLQLPNDLGEDLMRSIQCSMIYDHVLEKYYGVRLNEKPDLVFPVADPETGMTKYFKMRYDRRFIELHAKAALPALQDCAVCLNTFRILDLEQQLKAMPLENFKAEGFAVWVAEDVTTAQALEQVKKILLRHNASEEKNILELKEAVKVLLGFRDIEIGLMPFVKINNSYLLFEDYARHSMIGKHWHPDDEKSVKDFNDFFHFQEMNPNPTAITNLDEGVLGNVPLMEHLVAAGYRSYIYYPMQNSEGLLGMLEIGSKLPNLLTQQVLAKLEPVMPLLSLAMVRCRETFDNRIEKLIKEKFTSLQPSVEWKFSEVAWKYLQRKETGTPSDNIIFDNVYPLYGAVDIRNSSTHRSQAIQKDLNEQLKQVDKLLDGLSAEINIPILEGIKFKNSNLMQSIEQSLLPEDEMRVSDFLENELNPMLRHLGRNDGPVHQRIQDYFEQEKECRSSFNHYRNEYEQSLESINERLAAYLEEQEKILQHSYPHYFEKYKTDGVEYDIYIGQSMAPENPFDLLYLKNMRLWQLQSMADMANITHQMMPALPLQLETTQLILIHQQPISISFRKDERRFDVEGSYNIRYEIMKKRIDKACIRHTGERLTQPGKIALVYSNQKEAQEYEEYIYFLQSKLVLKPGVEDLELEELQGLKGLRALRVEIHLVPNES